MVSDVAVQIALVKGGEIHVYKYSSKCRLKRLWDEFKCIKPNSARIEDDMEEKVMQFLMGLSEDYDHMRNQILVMEPLPSVTKTYSMINNVEKQRRVHNSVHETLENILFQAFQGNKGPVQGNRFYKVDKSHLKCDFCRKKVHVKVGCFKLKGYPDWWLGLKDNASRSKGKHVDFNSHKVLAVAKEVNGLYILNSACFSNSHVNTVVNKTASHLVKDSSYIVNKMTSPDVKLWHQRLGHASYIVLQHLLKCNNCFGFCRSCNNSSDSLPLVPIDHNPPLPIDVEPMCQAEVFLVIPDSSPNDSHIIEPVQSDTSSTHDVSLRQSTRHRQLPTWMKNYPVNCVSSTNFVAHASFLAQLSLIQEPYSTNML
ncbi:hypothetical protein LIER_22617 [Lithospermum erythrorhizon]|uniref:GAG-pre-integrase domain-containing protein n=1 Tax=Lithospermum erythrorhizon TaxID=34254 RepID=A0AAV3QUP4_LITER